MSILPLFDLKALMLLDLSFTADTAFVAGRLETITILQFILLAIILLSVMAFTVWTIESALALEIALRLLLFLFFSAFGWIFART